MESMSNEWMDRNSEKWVMMKPNDCWLFHMKAAKDNSERSEMWIRWVDSGYDEWKVDSIRGQGIRWVDSG